MRQAAAFAGSRVHTDSPNGGFADASLLNGRKLLQIKALGKHLGYCFGRNLTLHVHLGQFGKFREGSPPMPEPKGALRLRIWTKQDWLELRGPTDCRIFSDEQWQALEARIGPDPLIQPSVPSGLADQLRMKKTPTGVLLMDQKQIGGIGNVYRAELLFRASIHPDRPGKDVPAAAWRALWKDAAALMQAGMEDRRMVTTRAKDRPHPRGTALDQEVHYVYRRQGKPCRVCATQITSKLMAGRTVYWCPTCQKD